MTETAGTGEPEDIATMTKHAAGRPPGRRLVAGLVVAGLVAAAAVAATWWQDEPVERPAQRRPAAGAAEINRGAYLARVGNCAGCHTARGGQAYAGGRGIPTPFGTVYAGNLTPDAQTGLGRWSAEDFWQAMHQGRSRDGRLLTPAFPYTAFTHVTRADSDALYVYLQSLSPVVQPAPAHALRFPFNTQVALAVWRALYFSPAAPERAPGADARSEQSAQWLRGAYLVRGLGHCAECHAPRNGMGAAQDAEQLPGGRLPQQAWFAPALGPHGGQALMDQRDDLVQLLRTGAAKHGTAGGPMAEVVVNSTQHWTDDDLQAAALYLTSLPTRPRAATRTGKPTADEEGQLQRGRSLYGTRCAQCHGEQGEGAPGAYPPLAGNPSVTLEDPANVLQVIRHGGFAPATRTHPRPFGMPPAGLSPQELADVATFIRQSWGNRAPGVSVLDTIRSP